MRAQAVAVAALVLLASACGGDGARTLPDLTLDRLDAPGELRLDELRGTPTVVNLWATWCTPCRLELPAFDAVDRATDDDLVRFVGIDIGDDRSDAEAFVAEVGVAFGQYHDVDSELPAALGATGMPVTAFVAADGEVLEVHTGALDRAELEARLADHFGVPPG